MPIHSFQFMRFNSFMSSPSFQLIHVNSFISCISFHFISFHFISFQFASFQLTMNSYKLCLFFETSAPARAGHYLVYSVKPFRHWQQPEIVFALPFPEGSPLPASTARVTFVQIRTDLVSVSLKMRSWRR